MAFIKLSCRFAFVFYRWLRNRLSFSLSHCSSSYLMPPCTVCVLKMVTNLSTDGWRYNWRPRKMVCGPICMTHTIIDTRDDKRRNWQFVWRCRTWRVAKLIVLMCLGMFGWTAGRQEYVTQCISITLVSASSVIMYPIFFAHRISKGIGGSCLHPLVVWTRKSSRTSS